MGHEEGEPMPEPVIDVVYETTDAEDEYDRQCLDTALAEGGEPVPLDEAMAELGFTWDDLTG
ncbi:hypothetical protein [Frankia sp. CiP1_Cm_nod2]|uniref:hypothetical protein n=2 Tax=unclassified Frankia TaxID=2632575 RepID=UPI0020248B80